ncbi:hypothetical protein D3C86_1654260 [compost metagenome]
MVRLILQSSFFCAAVSAKSTSVQPNSSNTTFTFSQSLKMLSISSPSNSIKRKALTPSFKSNLMSSYSITHSTPLRSMNSKAEGITPARKMADTAPQACSFSEKEAIINTLCSDLGINLVTIFVTTPNVPSEPIIS